MKRSEFLKELYNRLEEHLDNNTNENLVDIIVGECEKLGMKPPETSRKEPGLIRNEWTNENWYPKENK